MAISLLRLPKEEPRTCFHGFISWRTMKNKQISAAALFLESETLSIHFNKCYIENNCVSSFQSASERIPEPGGECKAVIKAYKTTHGEHEGRYNTSITNEVAILINEQELERGKIVSEERNSGLLCVAETHHAYDNLQYSFIFWKDKMDTSLIFQISLNWL